MSTDARNRSYGRGQDTGSSRMVQEGTWPEEYERRYKGRKTHLDDRRWEKPQQPPSEGVTLPQDFLDEPRARKREAVPLPLSKTPVVCRSNQDKRRDVEAALRANPRKSNREIARETRTTHPFVANTRRKLESVTGSRERLKC